MSRQRTQPTFQIREYRRVPVHCPLYLSHDGQYGAGTVTNLSCGGWRRDSETPLAQGTILKLFVILPKRHKASLCNKPACAGVEGKKSALPSRPSLVKMPHGSTTSSPSPSESPCGVPILYLSILSPACYPSRSGSSPYPGGSMTARYSPRKAIEGSALYRREGTARRWPSLKERLINSRLH